MENQFGKNSKRYNFGKLNDYILGIILVVTVILNSGYVLSTVYGNLIPTTLLAFSLFLLSCQRLKNFKNNIIITRKLLFLIILLLGILLSTIFNLSSENFTSSIRFILIIIFAYNITQLIKANTFFGIYLYTMRIISIVSLFAFFASLFYSFYGVLPVVQNINGASYYNGIIFFIRIIPGIVFNNNIGIFWEPGLFASFLLLSLMIGITFFPDMLKKRDFLLFSFTLFTTRSTAGYILYMFILLALLSQKMARSKEILVVSLAVLIIVMYYNIESLVNILVNLDPLLFTKIVDLSKGTTSTRIYSPIINFISYLESPLFGHGFYTAASKYAVLINEYSNYKINAQTSTSTMIMAALGFTGFFYNYAWIYVVLSSRRISRISSILTIFLIFLILNKEPHLTNLGTWCILFSLFEVKVSRKNIIKNQRDMHFRKVKNINDSIGVM